MSFYFPPRGDGLPPDAEPTDYQPLDADLTAISEKNTADFALGLLELPADGAVRDFLGVTAADNAIVAAVNAVSARVESLEQTQIRENPGMVVTYYDYIDWQDQPSALSEWWVLARYQLDLTGYVSARVQVGVSIAGHTGAYIKFQYSLDSGSTWDDLTDPAYIYETGIKYSEFVTIPAEARTDVLTRLVGVGGNATADPGLVHPTLECRGAIGSAGGSGGGGGDDGGSGTAYPKLATLTEDFTGSLTGWTTSGNPTINTQDQLAMTPTALSAGLETTWIQKGPFDLASSSTYMSLDDDAAGTTVEQGYRIRIDNNNAVSVFVTNGVLYSRLLVDGAPDDLVLDETWDATAQRYMHIKATAGGDLEWYASNDADSWGTLLRTEEIPAAWDIGAVYMRPFALYYGQESGLTPALFGSIGVEKAKPTPPPSGGGGAPPSGDFDIFYDPADGNPGNWASWQDSYSDSQFGAPGGTQLSVVNSPVIPGVLAYRAYVNDGSTPGNGPRAELAGWNELYTEGQEIWIGDVLYLPSGMGAWGYNHHTILQLGHPGGSAAANELDIRDAGGYPHGVHCGGRTILNAGNMYGRAIPIEIRVQWSQGSGELEVWVDNIQAFNDTDIQTMAGPTAYLKQGQYGQAIGKSVYWHGIRVGPDRASVRR